jgi:oligopeptide transport system permease protein
VAGYSLRRLLLIIPVVWGAMTLLFFAFMVRGNPVDTLVGERAPSATVRAQITQKYGLDQPVLVRYGRYMKSVATGDLGRSYKQGRSVNDILKQTAPNSLRLAVWAIVIEVLIGLTAGVISAVRQYSFLDTLVTVSTTMLVAVPVFVLGYLFQYALGVYAFQHNFPAWMRFPTSGIGPNKWYFLVFPSAGQWKYLLLPAVTLASVSTAVVARMTRTTMLEVMRADYMRTAAAKGSRRDASS